MANEILYRADVIGQVLGEGERLPNQTRDPLPQCAVESLDVISDAPSPFVDKPIWLDKSIAMLAGIFRNLHFLVLERLSLHISRASHISPCCQTH